MQDEAKAKLNLTLKVLGRRADGFHEIDSLTVFAELSDSLGLSPGDRAALSCEGPFAGAIDSENLILRAAASAAAKAPGLRSGEFHLIKRLPVAAGIGGGSADAAAALRLLQRANPGVLSDETVMAIAGELGSDIAACLSASATVMGGKGERLQPVADLPLCWAVLANPGVPLSAGAVYAALTAPKLEAEPAPAELPAFGGSFAKLAAYLEQRGNDLQEPALRLQPVIGDVLAALSELEGALYPRLSGSGPTAFALFEMQEQALAQAERLKQRRPRWWVAAAAIG
ncbi:4-(cytidine 5'-diphospho)-2-C-methyl-D-erythritol kinase [Methyloligella sp. 2.7D]|uniref:4-(cytidine 5'-diphospho)-2-C-methyl-D-erythritol kinase n=1 Tax=Methyloligella sp. 2.7D TaxID=3085160 RepID=UPI002FDA200E